MNVLQRKLAAGFKKLWWHWHVWDERKRRYICQVHLLVVYDD